MTRIVLAFLVVFCAFYFSIDSVRHMTGKEQWSLTKTILYSIMCAVLTIVVLSIFVIAL